MRSTRSFAALFICLPICSVGCVLEQSILTECVYGHRRSGYDDDETRGGRRPMGGPERIERGYGGFRCPLCPILAVILCQPGAIATDSS